jgi:hypothetical protein
MTDDVTSGKLAVILALATDITWSASYSDRQDSVSVYARSERLPGAGGLYFELQTAATWRVRPSTCSLSRDEAAFWQRLSIRGNNPFAGFDITTAELAAVVPGDKFAIVLDGLRAIAARQEASAFKDAAIARSFRAAVREYDRGWACPVRIADGQFEDPGHRLRVEQLRERDEWRPQGCWVLRKVGRYPRSSFEPGWWATRRGADDEARRRLAAQAVTTLTGNKGEGND